MAGPFRATMFFKDDDAGWSETHWVADAKIANIDQTLEAAKVLAKKRAAMMGTGAFLTRVRVSDDSIRRDSFNRVLNLTGQAANPKLGVANPSDRPYSVILLRAESTSYYRKSIYLSGCPDINIIQPPGPDLTVNAWQGSFKVYRQELLDHWGFIATTRGGANPAKPIVGITNSGPFHVSVTGHGFPVNARVRIFGTTPRTPVSGVWPIDVIDANTFSLRGSTGAYLWEFGGFAQLYNKAVEPYTEVLINGETHHKRGRPFGQLAGRSKKRVGH
jgi:hypothetical protein